MKTLTAFGMFLALALGPWVALPVMADPDLDGAITALTCPDAGVPSDGSITVLGVTSVIPAAGIPVTGEGPAPITCSNLKVGDRVKVGCTGASCGTAAYIKFDPVSAESSELTIPSICDGFLDDSFVLSNGVQCHVVSSTTVKQKKPGFFLGSTPLDLINFLCATLPGAPGTLEIKCEGIEGPTGTINATKVELKK